MQKLIRQLKYTHNDIQTSRAKMWEVYSTETNIEIAEDMAISYQKLLKAEKAVSEALDIIRQIYQECYDD